MYQRLARESEVFLSILSHISQLQSEDQDSMYDRDRVVRMILLHESTTLLIKEGITSDNVLLEQLTCLFTLLPKRVHDYIFYGVRTLVAETDTGARIAMDYHSLDFYLKRNGHLTLANRFLYFQTLIAVCISSLKKEARKRVDKDELIHAVNVKLHKFVNEHWFITSADVKLAYTLIVENYPFNKDEKVARFTKGFSRPVKLPLSIKSIK